MNGKPLGLIEGFFGPAWPERERLAMAPFLQEHQFDFYLYAPKADPFLRKKWREPWAADYKAKLKTYSQHFRAHGLKFGVGLSPFELHKMSTGEAKATLKEKLDQLEEAGLDKIGLFFDDFPVHEDLAQKQLEAIDIVKSLTKAHVIFCPAFYTPDPILEKVFGKRPERYFDEIRTAPPEVDFCWTGPKVIPDEIPPEHLEETEKLLGRKPFLWDNLFANDGPRNCKFLKIRAPKSRNGAALAKAAGWAWNPMNQAALSRLVLLASKHCMLDRTGPEFALEQAIQELCPPGLASFVSEHKKEWLEQGLDKIDTGVKEAWRKELAAFDHPVAREISAWLAGEFVVGAECLTD